MKKMINGKVFDMTPEEISARLAEEEEFMRIKQIQRDELAAKAAMPTLEERVNELNAKLEAILAKMA